MSRPSDWFCLYAGHYNRGMREQIMRRSLRMAQAIGQERAGWYYRRLLPTRQVVKGPFKTFAAAVRAAPRRRA